MLLIADTQPLHGDAEFIGIFGGAGAQLQQRPAAAVVANADHAQRDAPGKTRAERLYRSLLGCKPLGQQTDLGRRFPVILHF